MNELNITIFQQDIVWGDPDANRHAVEKYLSTVSQHTDLFIVPETFTTGFGDHMATLAEQPQGHTLQWAQQMAAEHNFVFVGTWIVRDGECCYNRLHWVFPNGNFSYYDKAHTFRVSGEADQIARGTERKIFEYKGWHIKPAICYDLRFPKWLRNDNLDYDLLLVCANWPGSRHEAWTTLLKARAIENQCYVVGCNRTGTDGAGIPYTGNSALVDYKGFVQNDDIADEHSVNATIHKDKLDTFRQHWPFYLDFD